LEILALRQQVVVLNAHPRPQLNSLERLFWIALRRLWSDSKKVQLMVKPDTVVAWHRAGFGWYGRWHSRRRPGRPKIMPELCDLIRRLARENAGWGAPKIHGELLKLGFDVSESSRGISGGYTAEGSGQELVDLPSKPSRDHRGLRLFYRPHGDLPNALLPVRHRAQSASDPAI
jgi:hypothetical protein